MSVSSQTSMPTETAPTVFISYRHDAESIDLVRRLTDSLTSHGLQVWLDDSNIVPGQSIGGAIDGAIKRADAVLFVLTESSTNSSWISFEIAAAIVARQDDRSKLIIPVLAADVRAEDIPPLLQEYHGMFLGAGPNTLDVQVARLANTLNAKSTIPAADTWERYREIFGLESTGLLVEKQLAHRMMLERQELLTQKIGALSGLLIALTATAASALLATRGNTVVAVVLAIVPALAVALSLILRRTRHE